MQEEQPKPSDDGLDSVTRGLWIRILQDGLEIIESIPTSASAVQRYASSNTVRHQRTPQLQALQNWTEKHSADLKRMCDKLLPTRERFLWDEQAYRMELRNGIESQPAWARQLSPVPTPWRVPPLAHGNSKLLHDLLAGCGGDRGYLKVAEETLRRLRQQLGEGSSTEAARFPQGTSLPKFSDPQATLFLKEAKLKLSADPDYQQEVDGSDALLLSVLLRGHPNELSWDMIAARRTLLDSRHHNLKARKHGSRRKVEPSIHTIKRGIRRLRQRLGAFGAALIGSPTGAKWGTPIYFQESESL